ncbi:MAG TPA: sodium-dependent transporter [Wenzhouxiangellaceae bacterium]|nr:sodium-dependent transporter [Wenzhouxiangellaceae bacterium]
MPVQSNWSSRGAFILAAAGSAVGLGNLWRFPAEAGTHGGAAFVLVYLACIAIIGIPLLLAEFVIGRTGRSSAVESTLNLARQSGASPVWASLAWVGMFATFLALSGYTIVIGWVLYYAGRFATEFAMALSHGDPFAGAFQGKSDGEVRGMMTGLFTRPVLLLFFHFLVSACTAAIVLRGVRYGIESLARVGMPLFFLLILGIAIYAATVGDLAAATKFLFEPDFNLALQPKVMSAALGQAFFSLALGGAAMITYGAYVSRETSLPGASVAIAGLDTFVAIIAGFAIFPIVFLVGLEPSAGPGLIFQSLPLAFQTMPAGALIGLLFFILFILAGLTSSVAMLEVVVAWTCRRFDIERTSATIVISVIAFFVGLPALLSLNIINEVRPLFFVPGFRDANWFDAQFGMISRLLLPLAGLITAIFIGWIADRKLVDKETGLRGRHLLLWRFLVAWLCPLGLGAMLFFGMFPELFSDAASAS